MTGRISFAISLLLAVPALVAVLPLMWLFAGVLAVGSRLMPLVRRGDGRTAFFQTNV